MIKNKIVNRIVIIIKAAIIPILFILFWEWAAHNGHVQISIVSAPSKIIASWKELFLKGKYQAFLGISTQRFIKGFLFGTFFGLAFGILMGLSKRANTYLVAVVGLLRSIPLVAWVPIAILSLGVGEKTKIILVAIGCFWSVFLNTMDGIKGVNQKYLEVATVLEKKRITQIVKVVIPAAFPNIITGLREGFSNSWRSIVAAEMIGASSGIGYIITYGREISRPDLMYVGLITIALIGLVLELILLQVQKAVLCSYSR
ncbi:MAG: ABC transporter permease [Agathobacter sp.]